MTPWTHTAHAAELRRTVGLELGAVRACTCTPVDFTAGTADTISGRVTSAGDLGRSPQNCRREAFRRLQETLGASRAVNLDCIPHYSSVSGQQL